MTIELNNTTPILKEKEIKVDYAKMGFGVLEVIYKGELTKIELDNIYEIRDWQSKRVELILSYIMKRRIIYGTKPKYD